MNQFVIEALEEYLTAVRFSAEWTTDPRFGLDTGAFFIIKVLPDELDKFKGVHAERLFEIPETGD